MTALDRDDLLAVLGQGTLDVSGRVLDASNATLVGTATLDGVSVECVYKPTRGERPLWDFPRHTLGRREVATYEVCQGLGWAVVPPTVWREEGVLGRGMVQAWVEPGPFPAGMPGAGLVDVVEPQAAPPGWRVVLEAEGADGRDVELVHADTPELRRMVVLDVVVNNADRKGGHVLRGRTAADPEDRTYGVDHGLAFHEEDKLRTVLWGFAGQALEEEIVDALVRFDGALAGGLGEELADLVSVPEAHRTRQRVNRLLRRGTYPHPAGWPTLPWPPF